MFLFLDDERHPHDVKWVILPNVYNWTVVRNYNEFVQYFQTNPMPKFVSFDHDLADEHYKVMAKEVSAWSKHTAFVDDEEGGMTITFDYGTEKTGFDCAKWLVDFCVDNKVPFPEFAVHSLNPVGGKRIKDYIESAKKAFDFL